VIGSKKKNKGSFQFKKKLAVSPTRYSAVFEFSFGLQDGKISAGLAAL
jgi:hypothetical protein